MENNEKKTEIQIVISGQEEIKSLIEDLTTIKDLMANINGMATAIESFLDRHQEK